MKARLSPTAFWTASMFLWALMVAQGLQMARVFSQRVTALVFGSNFSLLPGASTPSGQWISVAVGLAFIFAGTVIFWLVVPQGLFLYLVRLNSRPLQRAVVWMNAGLALLRILEQVARSPVWDFIFSGLTISLVFLVAPIMIAVLRGRLRAAGFPMGTGILLGFLLDTLLHASFWTLDLSWQTSLHAAWVVVSLAVVQVSTALVWYRFASPLEGRPRFPLSLGQLWLAVFLMQLCTHHLGLLSVRTGWMLPEALQWILLVDVTAIGVVTWLQGTHPRRYRLWLRTADGALALGLLLIPWAHGWLFAAALALTQLALASHITVVLKRVDEMYPPVHLTNLGGGVAYAFLVMLFFGLGASAWVFPIAGLILLWATYADRLWRIPDPADRTQPFVPLPLPSLGTVALAGGVLALWLGMQPTNVSASPSPPPKTLRVMYLNVHQGMDSRGEVALDAVLDVVQRESVDVLVLSEASREWINGGYDVPAYLAHHLGWYMLYGPDVGDLSGNAILSRYPLQLMDATRLQKWPFFPGSYITASLQMADGTLYITGLHLDWGPPATTDSRREASVRTYVMQHPEYRAAWLIGGDFNTTAASPRAVLEQAGLQDVWGDTSTSPITWRLAGDGQRLDYVFASPAVQVLDRYLVQKGDVSDHLPLLVEVQLQP